MKKHEKKELDRLSQMAKYDKTVYDKLEELYVSALDRGKPTLRLLEVGITAKRGYNVLNIIAGNYNGNLYGSLSFDKYVSNKDWSDELIIHIIASQHMLLLALNNGYRVLEVITPEHTEQTIYTACRKLSNLRTRISIEWMRNPNWSDNSASVMIDLMSMYTDIGWEYVLFPWMSCFTFEDISCRAERLKYYYKMAVVNWINVTPKLDYCINIHTAGMTVDAKYKWYESAKSRYKCDGDELADCINTTLEYDSFVLRRSKLYHEQKELYLQRVMKCSFSEYLSGTDKDKRCNPIFDAARLMGG